MIISQLEEAQSQVVLSIEVEPPELEEHLDRVYRRAVQRVNIPGFRRGKAPRSVVERELGRDAMVEDALETLLPQITSKAIQEQSLDVISLPKVRVTEYNPLTIEATVPVRPTVDLGDYYSYRLEPEEVEVTPESIDELVESMRQEAGTWEPVDRPVALDDLVTLEVRGLVDEEVAIEEERVDFRVTADSTAPMPGFAERLVGLNRDEGQEFSLPFSEDHAQENWSGKECAFTLTVHEVKERKIPDLDDEFAKSLNIEVESVPALRDKLNEDMLRRNRLIAEQSYQEQAILTLLEGTQVEVPPLLVDHEVEHMISEQQEALQRQQLRMEDYLSTIGKSVEQIQEELRPSAADRITRTLVLGALREKEGIEVSPEEIDEEIESMLGESDAATESVRQMLEGSKNSIGTMLLNRKTLARLTAITRGEATEPAPAEASAPDATSTEEESKPQEGA